MTILPLTLAMIALSQNPASTTSPADFNNDGVVDGIDFGLELVAWGECPSPCPQDLNNDGEVNGIDIGLFLVEWGPCN